MKRFSQSNTAYTAEQTEENRIKSRRLPLRMPRPGGGSGRRLVMLTCKLEIPDQDSVEGKVGAYSFQDVSFDRNGDLVINDPDKEFQYPENYAREINFSNANLDGPTSNLVFIEFTSSFDIPGGGTGTIHWFDKAVTDERYEDRDVLTPQFFYCERESSSSSSEQQPQQSGGPVQPPPPGP